MAVATLASAAGHPIKNIRGGTATTNGEQRPRNSRSPRSSPSWLSPQQACNPRVSPPARASPLTQRRIRSSYIQPQRARSGESSSPAVASDVDRRSTPVPTAHESRRRSPSFGRPRAKIGRLGIRAVARLRCGSSRRLGCRSVALARTGLTCVHSCSALGQSTVCRSIRLRRSVVVACVRRHVVVRIGIDRPCPLAVFLCESAFANCGLGTLSGRSRVSMPSRGRPFHRLRPVPCVLARLVGRRLRARVCWL